MAQYIEFSLIEKLHARITEVSPANPGETLNDAVERLIAERDALRDELATAEAEVIALRNELAAARTDIAQLREKAESFPHHCCCCAKSFAPAQLNGLCETCYEDRIA